MVAMVAMAGFCSVEEKLAGPFHEYVTPPLLAARLNVAPEQTGFGFAEAVGAAGFGLTVTVTIPAALAQEVMVLVAMTEYVPALIADIPGCVGFCKVEVKAFGPDQLYVNPVPVAFKLSVVPTQTGLREAVAAGAGVVFTVTVIVFVEAHPPLVPFTV
jgi:hypothetical protein